MFIADFIKARTELSIFSKNLLFSATHSPIQTHTHTHTHTQTQAHTQTKQTTKKFTKKL